MTRDMEYTNIKINRTQHVPRKSDSLLIKHILLNRIAFVDLSSYRAGTNNRISERSFVMTYAVIFLSNKKQFIIYMLNDFTKTFFSTGQTGKTFHAI